MLFVFVLLLSLVVASFFGHAVHWALHQKWSGFFNRGHMQHHNELYPPGKLVSDEYRQPKWHNNGLFLFTPPTLVILGAAGGLLRLCGAPWWALAVLGTVIIGFAFANDYVHDSYHLRRHWLNEFRWYRSARILHFLHHSSTDKNFGIFFFGWDSVFKTFRRGLFG